MARSDPDMARSDPELWHRLMDFTVGRTDVALTFVQRLARENGWAPEFAARVFEEYRRFVYLCMVSPWPMTPADAVDQAWHLHLTYSRSYWHDLCRTILGRPLHHGPTEGGPAEGRKYRKNYEATLALYTREFGAPPPADIWPGVDRRFADAAAFERVNTRDYWVIDKRHAGRLARFGALALALPSMLLACSAAELELQAWGLPNYVVWIALGLVAFAAVFWIEHLFLHPHSKNPYKKTHRGGGCGTDLDPGGDGGCSGCSD